jgi:hypothetical protein
MVTMSDQCRIIDVHRGGQSESWLTVYANGRIEYHVENHGYRFVRHGAEAREEWVDLYYVRQNWPQLVDQVGAALIELSIKEPEWEQPVDSDPLDQVTATAFNCLVTSAKDVNQFTGGTDVPHPELIAAYTLAIATLLAAQQISDALKTLADATAHTGDETNEDSANVL